MQTELDFEFSDENHEELDSQAATPRNWLNRTYQSKLEGQVKAREVFVSVNGDSNVARNRVASQVREFFEKASFAPEDVERWKKGTDEKEFVRVVPPKISASNSSYIDWLHIADFLLMSGCAEGKENDEEQRVRDAEFQDANRSYKTRLAVEEARTHLRREQDASDESLWEHLKEKFPKMFKKKVPKTLINEAGRLEQLGVRNPALKAPINSDPIPRFTPIYFQG